MKFNFLYSHNGWRLGQNHYTRVIEQKLQIYAVERHRLPQSLQKFVHMGVLTCCSMTTPGIQAFDTIAFDTILSRYMKGRGIMKGIRQDTFL